MISNDARKASNFREKFPSSAAPRVPIPLNAMTHTTHSQFIRYSAAVGATVLGAATVSAAPGLTVFSSPYATGFLPISPSSTSPADLSTSGAWTWDVTSGSSSKGTIAANSTTSLTLKATPTINDYASNTFEVRTTAITGYDSVSFNYSVSNSGMAWAYFFKNGTSTLLSGTNSSTILISPGDVFGFRVSASYMGAGASLTISNLTATPTAAVPEPASTSTWMAAGVAGLVAMRELRRKRRAPAAPVAADA